METYIFRKIWNLCNILFANIWILVCSHSIRRGRVFVVVCFVVIIFLSWEKAVFNIQGGLSKVFPL